MGTYSVNDAEDLLEQAPENVPHCIGMLRHEDRLALVIDLRRLLEVYPGPEYLKNFEESLGGRDEIATQ